MGEQVLSSVTKDVNAPYGLTPAEDNWSHMKIDLEARGYMLRRRYHPGWVGSWVGKRWKIPSWCEDSIGISEHGILMDAVRIRDGQQVSMKLWDADGPARSELATLQYFSDPSRINDPHNHCVPLLDVLELPAWSQFFDGILVEPLFRGWQAPPHVMVAEFLSFALQALEGLAYMHHHNVSHGDIHGGNIMMDPKLLYPAGFHGAYSLDVDHRRSEFWTKRLTRMQVPVKYYYIDFGSSTRFASREERRPIPFISAVFLPPELRQNPMIEYDSFKGDVFALGVTLLGEIRFRTGLHFLAPLFLPMMANNPMNRPEVQEVLNNFKAALQRMPASRMRGKIGFARDAGASLGLKLWSWTEYLRVLWHSYRYGFPKDILLKDLFV